MTTMPRAALIGLLAIAGNAAAHGGRLNAEGCHNDRRNGGYHCHRGGNSRAPAAQPGNNFIPTPGGDQLNNRPRRSAVYYANCSQARAAGAAPVLRGDPGYAQHLDRDGDGVGCE